MFLTACHQLIQLSIHINNFKNNYDAINKSVSCAVVCYHRCTFSTLTLHVWSSALVIEVNSLQHVNTTIFIWRALAQCSLCSSQTHVWNHPQLSKNWNVHVHNAHASSIKWKVNCGSLVCLKWKCACWHCATIVYNQCIPKTRCCSSWPLAWETK